MNGLDEATLDKLDELSRQREEKMVQRAEMLDRLKSRPCTPGRVWHSNAQQMHHAVTHLGLEIRRIDAEIDALLDAEVN